MNGSSIAPDLLAQAAALETELKDVERALRKDLKDVLARAFPDVDPGLRPRAIIGDRTDPGAAGIEEFDAATQEQRSRLLEAGLVALEKRRESGDAAELTPEEELGLEAIMRFTVRPAIMMKNGKFAPPPPPWDVLDEFREGIEENARGVGRIQADLPLHPFIGTGFLVAENVLMTNCHVARDFCALGGEAKWILTTGLNPTVDFVEDPDADSGVGYAIDGLIGIHDVVDLALLRVKTDGAELAEPLSIASGPPPVEHGRKLYVVGYAAPDYRSDTLAKRQVFGDVYNVKRLQPGAMLSPPPGPTIRGKEGSCSFQTPDENVFAHDASTLGGNSGSCVVDLETNLVIGLHYSGLYTKYNQAVALWTLADDPLLTGAGVNFD